MNQGKLRIDELLQNVPAGALTIISDSTSGHGHLLMTDQFQAKTEGKGRMELYSVFTGLDASYDTFGASEVVFHHMGSASILELFYCHSGRVGWNMRGGTAVYLGAGDMSVHSATCCSDSAMMLPLGYAEGISISIDMSCFSEHCPEILREAGLDLQKIMTALCAEKPLTISSCPELDGIFTPLYSVSPVRRKPYLQLKVQELLLYLMDFQPSQVASTQYFSQQTELIKKIHNQLTSHLDQRFTIEELSKQYLINTSTLKEVFKAVYGLPIATYMKDYRIREAMKLLRETDATIAEIACKVGYGTQGKFSKAFTDVTQMRPTEYRKFHNHKSGPPGL